MAVVVTTQDEAVPVYKQRELAAAARAGVFEAAITHLEVVSRPDAFNPPLLQALDALRSRQGVLA